MNKNIFFCVNLRLTTCFHKDVATYVNWPLLFIKIFFSKRLIIPRTHTVMYYIVSYGGRMHSFDL